MSYKKKSIFIKHWGISDRAVVRAHLAQRKLVNNYILSNTGKFEKVKVKMEKRGPLYLMLNMPPPYDDYYFNEENGKFYRRSRFIGPMAYDDPIVEDLHPNINLYSSFEFMSLIDQATK